MKLAYIWETMSLPDNIRYEVKSPVTVYFFLNCWPVGSVDSLQTLEGFAIAHGYLGEFDAENLLLKTPHT